MVLREAKQRNARRVLKIEVDLGELSLLQHEQVRFWMEHLFSGTPAEHAEIVITSITPMVSCATCGYEGGISVKKDPVYHMTLPSYACPRCGSAITVELGMECILRHIEMELPEETPSQG